VVVDGGKPIDRRDRDCASDVATGVGGAGLFSDGTPAALRVGLPSTALD